MSELQRQVERIRAQNVASQPVHRGRASLFMSPSEAAGIDMSVVLDAAQNGLMILNQYDSRFGVYSDNLLHSSSVAVQRELKSKEENATLDKEIHMLLSLLSLFSSDLAAHSVLEYLIQRYRIHELNSDALIRCLLGIHDTKVWKAPYSLVNSLTNLKSRVIILSTCSIFCTDFCKDHPIEYNLRIPLGIP